MAGPPIRVVNKAIDPSLIKHIDSVGRDGFISLIKNSIKALNPELQQRFLLWIRHICESS
ncbi:hypothetical protein BJX66DRAFT_318503 [Aspergillus keveii]|uniref:Uncharacterized protein n=1 Tax=Aspergillus keveii TaxID=714993 RepID=A0ABR4FJP0_9EURO